MYLHQKQEGSLFLLFFGEILTREPQVFGRNPRIGAFIIAKNSGDPAVFPAVFRCFD
jgi:hypothetical protein